MRKNQPMNKVALIIIFNHQFNKNIEILERIYSLRFKDIYYLVPFYRGNKPNVIPIYENSYYFQGYIAQGFKFFYKKEYKHYIFISDDLLLNPNINEENYMNYFKLKPESNFIPHFINLHEKKQLWPRVKEAYYFSLELPGIEISDQLPDYDTAYKKFKNLNLTLEPLKFKQIWNPPTTINDWLKAIKQKGVYSILSLKDYLRFFFDKLKSKKYTLKYPLVGSYSDICIVSSDAIKDFCHYCGIFAVARLFIEVGLPTSLVLAAKDIITEKELTIKGKALWPDGWFRLTDDTKPVAGDYKELKSFNYNLNILLQHFPSDYLYLHPIKLSKWKVEP